MKVIGEREWNRLWSRKRLASSPDRPLIATSAVTLDERGVEVWSVNADSAMQGGSTIKLLTGVLADERLDGAREVTVVEGDSSLPPTRLRPGDTVSVEALLQFTLVASDGHAAGALARAVGEQALIDEGRDPVASEARARMLVLADARLREIGWHDHVIADPTGADPANSFTMRELAALFFRIRAEWSNVHEIASKRHSFALVRRRGRTVPMFFTNVFRPITIAVPELIAGKTGWRSGPAYFVWSWRHPDGRIFTSALGGTTRDDRPGDVRMVVDRSVAASR
ncbi:MAG: serine hydrolase [Canibacter sp.]